GQDPAGVPAVQVLRSSRVELSDGLRGWSGRSVRFLLDELREAGVELQSSESGWFPRSRPGLQVQPERKQGSLIPIEMTAKQLFQAGQLNEAMKALAAEVRDNPTDPRRRTFLFELLCFAGEYDRAEKHLH